MNSRPIAPSAPKSIILSTREGFYILPFEDIIRLKAAKNYTTFYCQDRNPITIAKTLKAFESLLPVNIFFRIHKSHLINVNHISHWYKGGNGHVKMKDESKLPISRYKKKAFLEMQYSRSIQISSK